MAVLLATVCLLPWIHGGSIPLARLVLQLGAAVAAVFSLVSCLLRHERPGYPAVVFPLAILAAVGVIQLIPLHAPIISQMNHAVHADLRPGFTGSGAVPLAMRTASPGDTRLVVAQLVALMLLASVAFDQLRERRAVMWSLTAFTLNASVLSILALAQLFRNELFLIRGEWWTGMGRPFGTFVNPNNAAGWLLMGAASAVGLLVLQTADPDAHHYETRGRGYRSSGGFDAVVRYFARLSSGQVIAWLSLALIVSAMLATRSRTGMVAFGVALAVTMLIRIRARRMGMTLVVAVAGLAGVAGLMWLLNLQGDMIRELQTLRDPAGQLAGRLRHWQDSVAVVLDFPVFGAGLGAYRYVTLPYQKHMDGYWFHHADNQYLEVLVEAGVVGCLAFILLGLPILIKAVRIVRRSVAGGMGPSAETIAFVLLFVTVAQGMVAVADYGAVLPSTSAMFVTLVSMLAAIQAEAGPDRLQPPNRMVTAGTRIALILGALVFITDLVRAHHCYMVVIEAGKVAGEPLSWETIRSREDILDRAFAALEVRGDDARTHEVVSRLLRDTTRSGFLRGIPGMDEQENFKNAWPNTACFQVARRIDGVRDKPTQSYLRSMMEARTRQSGLLEHCEQTVRRIPLAAPVVRRAARWANAAGMEDPGEQLALRARFNEPANGVLLVQLGELALRAGDSQRAVEIWNDALRLDESLRCLILNSYVSLGRQEEGLAAFGPDEYVEVITALKQSPAASLNEYLFELADELWTEPESPPSVELQHDHSWYLKRRGRGEERIEWLKRCVDWSPDELEFRKELARQLHRQGDLRGSLQVWYDVLRLDHSNELAVRETARIELLLDNRANHE